MYKRFLVPVDTSTSRAYYRWKVLGNFGEMALTTTSLRRQDEDCRDEEAKLTEGLHERIFLCDFDRVRSGWGRFCPDHEQQI